MSEDANTIALRRWNDNVTKYRKATDQWVGGDELGFACPYCDHLMWADSQCRNCGWHGPVFDYHKARSA